MKTTVTLYAYLDQPVPIAVPKDGTHVKSTVSDMELEITFELDIDPGEEMSVDGITLKPSISSMEAPFDDLLYEEGMEAIQNKADDQHQAHIDSQIAEMKDR